MPHRDLDVLEAAQLASERVNSLIDESRRKLLHVAQLRDSVQSIPANIAEGYGKGTPGEIAKSLRTARGESEETIRHLRSNLAAKRITARQYWPLHNLLVVIVKMLDSLLR
jgi:four helix bundle protein